MALLGDIPFVVVDVETSGPNHITNRIIEIGCAVVLGGEIVDEFESLVNPHQFIPPYIVKMTGISYKMAFAAPELKEVIPHVRRMLEAPNAVFVAHNASFDWGFVRSSFHQCGMELPEIPRICTIKLARRLIAKSQKKNLGSLADYFNINVKNRHRAFGDAYATAQILIEMFEILEQEHNIDTLEEVLKFQNRPIKQFLPPTDIIKKMEPTLATLPSEPGVYYFSDKLGNILYVGKAKCLKDRVRSYFQTDSLNSKKICKLLRDMHSLRWEVTETELAALLLESREIKRYKPPFNILEKNYRNYPFLQITSNERFPRVDYVRRPGTGDAEYYGPFRNASLASEVVETINKKFKLRKCAADIVPNPDKKPCFYYHIDRCCSPCSEMVNDEGYAAEVDRVRNYLSGFGDGVIAQLESKMTAFADTMNFEAAASVKTRIQELKRVLGRASNVATSINQYNLLLVVPGSERDKTIEVFIIGGGRLIHQQTIGRAAPLGGLNAIIHETFFNGRAPEKGYSQENIDELRIINSWLHRNQFQGRFIYCDGMREDDVLKEFADAVRNAFANTSPDDNPE